MKHLMLLGDEAVGQGVMDAGLSGIYAYPGTPSTEIMEYIQSSPLTKQSNIRCEWSANEKTALEAALGMSYAGQRTIACMKHVGLNVAADPFINAAITGVNGGLIIVVADDPSMHSSQNEQDSRFFGKFAMVPVLEPSDQQEAYDMAYTGFSLSEKYNIPVLLRLTTRLAHSRSGIKRSPVLKQKKLNLPADPTQFILLPAMARKKYKRLISQQSLFEYESSKSSFNKLIKGKNKNPGIIACGLAYNYLIENFEDHMSPYTVFKISQYPVSRVMMAEFLGLCREMLVLEEGYPLIEESLRGMMDDCRTVHGRMDGYLPRDGELNPDLVADAIGLPSRKIFKVPDIVRDRPPSLCKGCSHADVFSALNEAIEVYGKGRVFSDIGCYTLGAFPPYNAIYTCVDMGASVTMAKGAADAGLVPAVTVIGDSTFTHSGMTGLLDAVNDQSPVTIIISDNSTTAMTGGQKSSATGRLADICSGIGVEKDHIRTIIPLKKYHRENVIVLKEELGYHGVSVIIAQRECIQTAGKKKRAS
ncbi:MAG: indolepyruvate ferredoxin oxidoreductase [Bacteroides sp. SM23_62_1]|nr:MAG: indolepyruvate ferredoxin oxidoreductase [Bacteroides sp. SM23_62_1]